MAKTSPDIAWVCHGGTPLGSAVCGAVRQYKKEQNKTHTNLQSVLLQ